MSVEIYFDTATRQIGDSHLWEIFGSDDYPAARMYALLEISDIDPIVSALTSLSTGLSNEATVRLNTDEIIFEYIDILSRRISNLLEDPIPQTSQLDGSRIRISEFFEVFTEDQIDGLTQRLAVFTNALSSKMEDILSTSDAGLTFDKTNPSRPIVTQNRPLWNEVRNKPTSFPPTAHTHTITDVTNLQTSLDSKIPLSQKGVASGVASLDGSGKIPASQIPVFDPALQIVNTIAERNALNPTANLPVYVKNATGDPTVTTGGAFYLYELSTTSWIKLSEMESMEIVQSWANVTGKPSSFPPSAHGHLASEITEDSSRNFISEVDKTALTHNRVNLGDRTGSLSITVTHINSYSMRLTGNLTLTLSNPSIFDSSRYLVNRVLVFRVKQDGTGGRTIAFGGSNVVIASGETIDTGANKVSILTLYWDEIDARFLGSWKKGWS